MAVTGYATLLQTAVNGGISRTRQRPVLTAALTFLAGAYIALGGFLAVRCGLALPWEIWGSMSKFIFAAVFPLGLMLVVLCGADLFTGNCMTLAAARYQRIFPFLRPLPLASGLGLAILQELSSLPSPSFGQAV